jgi:holo-[acyl-carrier protein] synthase
VALVTPVLAGVVGIGTDAVDIARFRRVLLRTPGFAARVFTADELAYANRANDPTERLAARFAAKEATMKALGVGLGACRMTDIEVARDPGGRPHLVLDGRARTLALEQGVARWHLSLTHTALVAFAVALGEA